MRPTLALAGVAMAGGLLAAGCAAPTLEPGALASTSWRLVTIDGRPALDSGAWIAFGADGSVVGHSGCNNFRGRYSDMEGLGIVNVISTRKFCPPGPDGLDVERAFFQVMTATANAERDETTLTLIGRNGAPLARLVTQ
ncbi:MAG: META domain-containing protein [Pseudomonadota bacterium]